MTTTSTPGAGEFPPLPDAPAHAVSPTDIFTSFQMRAFAEATVALRAQAAEGEQSAAHAAGQEAPADDFKARLMATGRIANFKPDGRPAAPVAATPAPAHPLPVALPTRKGVYAWVTPTGHASLVLVDKRPTPHSPGGVLNASVMDSSEFYDGCAVESWGKDGRWVLLHDFGDAHAAPAGEKGAK